MNPRGFSSFLARTVACWNWKCALLSATARSIVYLAALARTRASGGLPIVLVEIVYVTLTAGLYAGLQQRALGFRSRILGNLTIALGVPLLAQTLDWFAHRAAGAAAPGKATLTVCVFASVCHATRRLPDRQRRPLPPGRFPQNAKADPRLYRHPRSFPDKFRHPSNPQRRIGSRPLSIMA
jgi:hypothetical protein